jgi:AraC-like DNA-binding protein
MSRLPLQRVASVIDRLQSATGQLLLVERTDFRAFLRALANSLPEAKSPAETLILRSLLFEFAAQAGDTMHNRVHAVGHDKRCSFVPVVLLEPLWKYRTVEPVTAFRQWLDTYWAGLNHAHPVSAAGRVAQLLRRDYRRQWDMTTLARQVHVTPSSLTRAFKREYGRSMFEYQRDVRAVEALRRVRDMKVEAVALEVGYRSKKNLYALLSRATGISPTAFRELGREAAQQIIDAACLRLLDRPTRRLTDAATMAAEAAHPRRVSRGRLSPS